jgi:uncharacterized protein (DUF1778 family)
MGDLAMGASAVGCGNLRGERRFSAVLSDIILCIDIAYTKSDGARMPKSRTASKTVKALEPIGPPRGADAKGSINLRVGAQTRQLIDDAAAVLGKTRTEFMIESARRQAVDVLLDQRLFSLDPERHDAFLRALDNPPAPGPKLRALLRRIPAWERR